MVFFLQSSISEKMGAQIRGLGQAQRNAQDGISMNQTANDTNTADDRNEIQKEMNQLTSEINRIANTTEFNTQKLLDDGADATAQATALASAIQSGDARFDSVTASSGTLTFSEGSGEATGSAITPTITGPGAAAGVYYFELTTNLESGESITIGDVTLTEGTDFDAGEE